MAFHLTFPDGASRAFDAPLSGAELAASISKSLAKKAVLIEIDGALKDLSVQLTHDARVRIITRDEPEVLEVIRHDCAHIMAEAVKELYPETQVTIGPAIDDGFYYDFYRAAPFTPDDLEKIEKRMRDIVARAEPLTREEWTRDQAVAFFKKQGEEFKVELIESIPASETLSVYRQGDFLDLCRGPHLPSTAHAGTSFKLMKLAGAYWRGDSARPQLQRIYGTAWANDNDLATHLHRLEEAQKRDHRKVGPQMGLFHIQEEAAGSVFWHAKGWTLYRTLENYIRDRIAAEDYIEVRTPQLVDRSLWEASGHWEKFGANMFTVESENKILALKPMNCPCHVQIFNQGIKSYRDLPLRMAEFGSCMRNELSGSLHGIMRVRSFTQDDAHIFCTEEQINSETVAFCALLKSVYRDFGFDDVLLKFSTRPAVRAGSDETWDRAEKALADATREAGLDYTLNPGEGAFYGPKLEFTLRDSLGREWQCGTLQVDFVLPERLGANYIGEDGAKHRPVMLHRAILGSLERFIGVLIEHYSGNLPLWLAPTQVTVATVVSGASDYAAAFVAQLAARGIRTEIDTRNEKINYKIREHSLAKVPVIAAVGERDMENSTVSLRFLGSDATETLALSAALDKLAALARAPHRPV